MSTSSNPVQETARAISTLQMDLGRLQEGARLARVRDSVEDLHTSVNGLAQRVATLRQNGYAFEKEMENQATDLAKQWATLHPSVMSQINAQAASLQAAIRPLETQVTQAAALKNNPSAARGPLSAAQAAAKTMEGKVEAAERAINGMFDSLQGQVITFRGKLDRLEWMLNQIAESTIKLLPTESGIMAVKAVWYQNGKETDDSPEGVLYLTDQRLLFEQKEEVATKKVLFITTEKKKVQEIEWEVPVALVEGVTTSKQGLMKNEDHIHITFAVGAPYQRIDLHIWQPCEQWVQMINRAKSKDYDAGRAIAIDQAVVDAVKNLPSQCPSCGGNLNQVVLRGQDSVKCEYCGAVIRL